MKKVENNKNDNCIFCYSILFSNLKINYNNHLSITTNCFHKHKKEIDLSLFIEFNNKSFDNNKLKVECPFCKELLDKDMYFMCIETNQLICPKCIALNIIILSSNEKKKKSKKTKKQPHYSTLISLLKELIEEPKEKINFDLFNDKIIEEERKVIISKYNQYREIIIDEKEQKNLDIIYNFIFNLNCLKKRLYEVYKENKNYLSKFFYQNITHILSFNNIKDIFINNFYLNNSNNKNINISKELKVSFNLLYNCYNNKIQNNNFISKISSMYQTEKQTNNKNNAMNCIYEQESIISCVLYFNYEINDNEKEAYLIISSNNGIINILNTDTYKSIYIIDIFQSKGIYHLIQSKNEKNTFYASSWGCFKKIKLIKEIGKESNLPTFRHSIIKTYKKSDIIRILKLIELSNNNMNNNIQNNIISLDEGGHIISWGYNPEYKKDIKEEIFVSDREDSINNMILFISNKLKNMLIFSTRNSTLLGSIYFYNIKDSFYELKCLKNKFKSKIISFDLQYNTLTQVNDYMIVFPQNKKLIFIDVKTYQIATIVEMEIDLIKDKFYNYYGETIGIIKFKDNLNNNLVIFSSKGFICQYCINSNNKKEIFYLGKYKYELKEEIEYVATNNCNDECGVDLSNKKLYIKFNKKIVLIEINDK